MPAAGSWKSRYGACRTRCGPRGTPNKYSLFYGHPGKRLVGFDNEQGKGDHMHIAGSERPYAFTDIDQLLADFFAEVRKAGGEP